tara:strand:- start:516 stop:1745 length:1230 start_codon:yes stop_codon:yes gene_type:complete
LWVSADSIRYGKQNKGEIIMDFNKMNPLFETIKIALATTPSQPVLVWGADGCGKSRGILSLIEDMENTDGSPVKSWFLNGNSMEPTDMAGLFAREDEKGWGRVPVLRALKEAVEETAAGRQYVFVFEEFTTMNKATMAPFLSFISEKVAGDCRYNEDLIHIIALANPPEIAVNPTHLAPPVSTRFLHLQWEMDFGYWAENMMEGTWFPGTQEAAADVISFLYSKGAMPGRSASFASSGFAEIPSREFMNKTRGNPRTWTNLIKMDTTARTLGVEFSTRKILFRGAVGEGMGREYGSWLQMKSEGIDPIEALKDPENVILPVQTDRVFAFFNAVAARVSTSMDPKEWQSAWVLLGRCDDKDLGVLAARTLAKLPKKEGGRKLFAGGFPKEINEFGDLLLELKSLFSKLGK